jgi:hypothetical protein
MLTITCDLNGFAFTGGSGAGIRGFARNLTNPREHLRVVNGTVRGWDVWDGVTRPVSS